MRFLKNQRLIVIGLIIASTGCSRVALEAADDAKKPVSFEKEVQPLLKSKCWKCHGATVQKGELGLHTPAAIEKGSESGPVVIAGKSAESRLFELVKKGEMPPDGQDTLTETEVQTVKRWIDEGAHFGDKTAEQRSVTQHDVIPIMLLRCTVCHGRHKKEGGLDLRNRDAMLRGGNSGTAIVLGKSDESLMIKRIRAEEMPPHKRLTEVSVKPMEPEELKTVSLWIELGAPVAVAEPDVAGTADDPLVRPQDKQFWSFTRPKQTNAPIVSEEYLLRSQVDAMIAQKLMEQDLPFSPEANRTALLRRVSFDLIGLPPSPTDVQEFLSDASPDFYERAVDRLLASPRYGERWGRHWLDVAGYSDCEGRREQHLPRPYAWRYRDYVIRSLNSDKPYDRFLQEQIAGDELADYQHAPVITQEIEDNLVATAFLRMSPDPTWANLTGYVPDRLEVTADSIDVLGSGIMGLTFKCARCHSHKFDPIPQRDYYRLVAMLKGAYDEHDWLKPQLMSFGGAMSAGLGERFLPYVTTEERRRWENHQTNIQQQIDLLSAQPKTPENEKQINDLQARRQPQPQLMALWDRGEPSPTYVYRRGNSATPGALVEAGVPAVLADPSKRIEIAPPRPGATSTGRRLTLARWLTEPDHPLTARVIVNRIWMHHFGHGIVRSLGNFGKTGDRPTHPELLDNLAIDFVRHGYRLKSLHRQMVLTTSYRQGSQVSDRAAALDPANWLLSRMPLRRLDAEELRDSILWLSDELNEAEGGPSEPVQVRGDGLVLTGKRRSVYVQQLRKHPPSLLESFDLPAMNPNCLQRTESLVPTQALHLWNDAAIRQSAAKFAERVSQPPNPSHHSKESPNQHQIEQIYWMALSRPPAADEMTACLEMLSEVTPEYMKVDAAATDASIASARKALAAVCHTILNSADFLYID